MADWYVLQTKVRQEVVAERNLKNQTFNTFLPMISVRKHIRGRWQFLREPLFPGYLFIELDLESQDTSSLRSTRGVLSLVRFGLSPQPLPRALLHGLQKAQEISGDAIDSEKIFAYGDVVELISGPMAGLKGIFHAQNSMERVVLLLNILGAHTRVSVSPHDVARAS